MPTHQLLCREGLLHVTMSQVNQPVSIEMLHQLFFRSGAAEILCACERVVDGLYVVEAYVKFLSRWRAARARSALDGSALYEGCCFLAADVVPPIYTAITTPDEMPQANFYDDTPYAEWVAVSAMAERQDEVDLAMVECHDGESTAAVSTSSPAASTPKVPNGDFQEPAAEPQPRPPCWTPPPQLRRQLPPGRLHASPG